MSDGTTSFFRAPENLAALTRLSSLLRGAPSKPEGEFDVAPSLLQILQVMLAHPAAFDELCTSNIGWIGQSFMGAVVEVGAGKPSIQDTLPDLFALAYRFICELEMSQEGDLSFELRTVKSFVENNLLSFAEIPRRQLVYAHYLMPASIARNLLHHPNVADARGFRELLASAATLKADWEKDYAEKEKALSAMQIQLANFSTAFNFVGLVDGFRSLAEKKETEKASAFKSLILLGVLAISPVALEVGFVMLRPDMISQHKDTLLYTLPALVTLEVILVYFFRIVLSHFRSLNAQLLQLDLRAALCKFIQAYATYSGPIKKQDASALEKFESLIFSGLIANEDSLPSTFDGTEQLGKLVKSMRA